MHKAIRTAVVCVAASVLAFAADDLKITYRTETKQMMTSKGAQVDYHSARYSLSKNDGEKKDTLIDYQSLVMYGIDHKKKVISKMTAEDILKAIDLMAAKLEEDSSKAEKVENMVKSLFGEPTDVSVKKVGTEQVAGRNCEKWDIAYGKLSCKASADPSLALPVDPETLEKANKLNYGAQMANPLLGKVLGKFYDAMYGIKGVRLKSEVVMPIGPMTTRAFKEATEVVLGPVPTSVFELPKGYKEEDAGKKLLADLEKQLK